MGVKLITEVLDHAPDDITSAELVVLLVLAENGRDSTREAFPGMDVLTRRSRLSPDGVRKALQRLAKRGLEVRVAIGEDRLGRPVYSFPGRQTTYRLPAFERRDAGTAKGGTDVPPNGGTLVPPKTKNGGTPVRNGGTPVPPNGGTPVPPFPSSIPSIPSEQGGTAVPPSPEPARGEMPPRYGEALETLPEPLRTIRRSLLDSHPDSTLDEAKAVHRTIAERHHPKKITYYQRIAEASGFGAYLADIRQADAEQRRRNFEAALRTAAPCEHGQPGGNTLHTTTGHLLCPLCRRGIAAPEPPAAGDPRVERALTLWRDAQLANGQAPTTQELLEAARNVRIAIDQRLYQDRTTGSQA